MSINIPIKRRRIKPNFSRKLGKLSHNSFVIPEDKNPFAPEPIRKALNRIGKTYSSEEDIPASEREKLEFIETAIEKFRPEWTARRKRILGA